MVETIASLSALTLMEIIGAIVLGAAIAYGIMVLRRRSRASNADCATRKLSGSGKRRDVRYPHAR